MNLAMDNGYGRKADPPGIECATRPRAEMQVTDNRPTFFPINRPVRRRKAMAMDTNPSVTTYVYFGVMIFGFDS